MSDRHFLTPSELSRAFVEIGVAHAELPIGRMFVLGILAGVYIGFGAHLSTTVGTGDYPGLLGLKKLLMGGVFSVGLMLVVIAGAELFTGNNMMTVPLAAGRLSVAGLVKNWVVVFIGNLVGSVGLAWIIGASSGLLDGPIGGTALKIAADKTSALQIAAHLDHNVAFFFRAVGCNWLVCLAVMLAVAGQDIASKVLAIFFPIMAFVAMGFEHSVANMYFIPAGIFAKAFPAAVTASGLSADQLSQLNWGSMWTQNLLSVTAGNLVGGGIFTGLAYWFVYIRPQRPAK